MIVFTVEGQPVAKQSYRAVKGGGYTNPKVKAWQNCVAWKAKVAMESHAPMTGPVAMRVVFNLKDKHRVDLDNLNKAICDALNGIVFMDDNQVVNLHLVKHIKDNPGVLIQVFEGELLPPFFEGRES